MLHSGSTGTHCGRHQYCTLAPVLTPPWHYCTVVALLPALLLLPLLPSANRQTPQFSKKHQLSTAVLTTGGSVHGDLLFTITTMHSQQVLTDNERPLLVQISLRHPLCTSVTLQSASNGGALAGTWVHCEHTSTVCLSYLHFAQVQIWTLHTNYYELWSKNTSSTLKFELWAVNMWARKCSLSRSISATMYFPSQTHHFPLQHAQI